MTSYARRKQKHAALFSAAAVVKEFPIRTAGPPRRGGSTHNKFTTFGICAQRRARNHNKHIRILVNTTKNKYGNFFSESDQVQRLTTLVVGVKVTFWLGSVLTLAVNNFGRRRNKIRMGPESASLKCKRRAARNGPAVAHLSASANGTVMHQIGAGSEDVCSKCSGRTAKSATRLLQRADEPLIVQNGARNRSSLHIGHDGETLANVLEWLSVSLPSSHLLPLLLLARGIPVTHTRCATSG